MRLFFTAYCGPAASRADLDFADSACRSHIPVAAALRSDEVITGWKKSEQ